MNEKNEKITYDSALRDIPNYGKNHPTYWGAAIAGEAGEFANLTKKIERDGWETTYHSVNKSGYADIVPDRLRIFYEKQMQGYDKPHKFIDFEKTVKAVMGDELADIMIYAHLIAEQYDIDLATAIENKKQANAGKRTIECDECKPDKTVCEVIEKDGLCCYHDRDVERSKMCAGCADTSVGMLI